MRYIAECNPRGAHGMSGMTTLPALEMLNKVWEYPLFAALYGRRSRRFGRGFEMAESPYRLR